MLVGPQLVLVDDLVTIGNPPSANIVDRRRMHLGDLTDGLERHLDVSRFLKRSIAQVDNEGLHLEIDVLEERWPLDFPHLHLLLLWMFLLSQVFQVLNHLADAELPTLGRVVIKHLRWC